MATGRWRALAAIAAAVALLVTAQGLPVWAQDEAAHALAERFSHASDDKSQAARADEDAARKVLEQKLEQEERLKADEAEMLARAKAEATEREATAKREADEKAAAAQRDLAAQRAAEETRKREEDRLAAEKAAAEKAAVEKAEAEKVRAEKAETARKAEKQRLAEQKAEAERREREAAEVTAREDAAREVQTRADAERKTLEAAREEETRQLSEKLTRAREKREAEKAAAEGYSALGNPPPAAPDSPAEPTSVVATQDLRGTLGDRDTRATILLVMEPGNRGIRRYQKSADPVLCVGQTCYISNGPEQAATQMPRGRAFGPSQTLGQRAGACRQSLTCVFRGIDLGAQRVVMQPVDLRILRHDRRETSTAAIDATCAAVSGHLSCSGGVASASYRLWVVPERVAETAGASALRAALAGRLPSSDAAQLGR